MQRQFEITRRKPHESAANGHGHVIAQRRWIARFESRGGGRADGEAVFSGDRNKTTEFIRTRDHCAGEREINAGRGQRIPVGRIEP